MGTKREDGTFDDPCLDKLKPGEPFFVLRAQDKTAAILVRTWAGWANELGVAHSRVDEATDIANDMDAWPHRKWPD